MNGTGKSHLILLILHIVDTTAAAAVRRRHLFSWASSTRRTIIPKGRYIVPKTSLVVKVKISIVGDIICCCRRRFRRHRSSLFPTRNMNRRYVRATTPKKSTTEGGGAASNSPFVSFEAANGRRFGTFRQRPQ